MSGRVDWSPWQRAALKTLTIFASVAGVVLLLVLAQQYRWVAFVFMAVAIVAIVVLTFLLCLATEVRKQEGRVK